MVYSFGCCLGEGWCASATGDWLGTVALAVGGGIGEDRIGPRQSQNPTPRHEQLQAPWQGQVPPLSITCRSSFALSSLHWL